MRILIIDDSKEDRDLFIAYIKETEQQEIIEIDESSNLTDALPKMKENGYDAILLDLMLPETEGLSTVKKTIDYLNEIRKDTPIIILTGLEDYKIGKKAFKLGIKDFLIKEETQAKELKRALSFATYANHLPSKVV